MPKRYLRISVSVPCGWSWSTSVGTSVLPSVPPLDRSLMSAGSPCAGGWSRPRSTRTNAPVSPVPSGPDPGGERNPEEGADLLHEGARPWPPQIAGFIDELRADGYGLGRPASLQRARSVSSLTTASRAPHRRPTRQHLTPARRTGHHCLQNRQAPDVMPQRQPVPGRPAQAVGRMWRRRPWTGSPMQHRQAAQHLAMVPPDEVE
jgi:hypothetical protein